MTEPMTDLEMMQTPAKWPLGFRLPLKRSTGKGMQHSFLLDYSSDEYWWFDNRTIFDTDVSVAEAVVIRRADLQTLIDQGWRVD